MTEKEFEAQNKAILKECRTIVKEEKNKQQQKQITYYSQGNHSLLGYFNRQSNYAFLIIIGPRKCGKTVFAQEHFLRNWSKCHDNVLYYFRLTEKQSKKLLANNAEKLFEPPVRRKFFDNRGLVLKTHGNSVYAHKVYKDKKGIQQVSKTCWKVAEIGALSTFYEDKGTATYDYEFLKSNPKHRYWIIVDEFQKEVGERSQGDIAYQFVNALHNKIRTTNKRTCVIMLCNNLRESSEILSGCFNFMPINYGLFKLKSKKAIIHYVNPQESYWKMMKKGLTTRLQSDDDATFVNEFKFDMSLINTGHRYKPSFIIRFSKSDEDCFIVWDEQIIQRYKSTKTSKLPNVPQIAMYKGLDTEFVKERQKIILDQYNLRYFNYVSLMDKTQFDMMIAKIQSPK